MTSINKLSSLDTLSGGDLLAVWATGNGDTRKSSLTLFTSYITEQLDLPVDISRSQYAAPTTSGFNVTIQSPNTWLVLDPTNNFAAGGVTLPNSVPDLSMISIVTTRSVTAFSVTVSGAAVVGAPTTINANEAFTLRYDGVTNSWYPENQAIINATAFAQTLLDDPDAATARTTLGLGSIATQAANSVAITGGSITGITDLAVADGGTGASDAASARTNLGLGTIATQASSAVSITGGSISGITDLAVADGGTGASDAAGARTNLGAGAVGGNVFVAATASAAQQAMDVEVGVDVQAWDADLDAVAGLAVNGMIARTGAGTAAARTITAGTGISVANGDGVSGNPTIAATSILENVAATDIAAIGNAINTTGKAAGRMIWDTTNTKIKVATGSAAADTWVDADGTNAVTPV
jgi:hypothetical protein